MHYRLPHKRGWEEIGIRLDQRVRPSTRPLGGPLRTRNCFNAIKGFPHAEERQKARLEARTTAVQPISSQARKRGSRANAEHRGSEFPLCAGMTKLADFSQ